MAAIGFTNLSVSEANSNYYEAEVADAAKDAARVNLGEYYAAPARWISLIGRMAEDGSEIKAGEITEAFSGHAPRRFTAVDRRGREIETDEIATNISDPGRKAGTDVTLSHTKGFSALVRAAQLAGEDGLVKALRNAKHDVIRDLVKHTVDTGLVQTRRGKAGQSSEVPADIMVAVVPHAVSRAGDPQEHDHIIYFNGGIRQDGTIGTLELENLISHKFYLQALAGAGMAKRLQELGFAVVETGRGQWELAGAPEELLAVWSKRRAEVLAGLGGVAGDLGRRHLAAEDAAAAAARGTRVEEASEEVPTLGKGRAQARREATQSSAIKTRRLKGSLPDAAGLEQKDRDELKRLSLTPEGVIGAMLAAAPLAPVPEGAPAEVAIEGLFERTSVATFRQFRTAIAEAAAVRGMSIPDVEGEVQRALQTGMVKAIGASPKGEPVLSTDNAIETERAMLLAAQEGRGQGKLKPGAAERAITEIEARERAAGKRNFSFAEEQRKAVRWASRGDQIAVIEGLSGTGKTTSMEAVVRAAKAQWLRTTGVAPTNTAAETLSTETHTDDHMSLQKLASSIRSGQRTLTARDYILIDEAGMAELGHVATVVQAARKAGAQVLLIGDERQFAPIGAGAPFAALSTILGTSRLSEIRRQRVPWQNAASRKMAAGDTDAGLMAYAAEGRWRFGEDRADAMSTLVNDWTEDLNRATGEGGDPATRIVIAQRHADVHDLNTRLRQVLTEKGKLGTDEIVIRTLHRDGRNGEVRDLPLRPGDELILWRRVPEHNLNNGDRIQVVGFKPMPGSNDGDVLLTWKVQKTGVEVTAPLSSLVPPPGPDDPASLPRLPFLQHAYAVSMYASQGKTVDQGFVYGGIGLDMRSVYVSLTRQRDDAKIYWDRAGIAQELVERGERPTNEAVVDHIRQEARKTADKYNVMDFVRDVDAWLRTGDILAERQVPSAIAARMQAAEENAAATVRAAAKAKPEEVRAIAAAAISAPAPRARREPRVSPDDRAGRAYRRAVTRSQGQAATADRRSLRRFEDVLSALRGPGGVSRLTQAFREAPRRLGREVAAVADRVKALVQWRQEWSVRQAADQLDARRREIEAGQGRGGVLAVVDQARRQPAAPEPRPWRDAWLHTSMLGRHAPEARTLPTPASTKATLAGRLPPLPRQLADRLSDRALSALAYPRLGTGPGDAATVSVRAYADALERERQAEQNRILAGMARWTGKAPTQVLRELGAALERPQAIRHDDLRAGVERLRALSGAKDRVERDLAAGTLRPAAPIQALDPAASPAGWLVALRKSSGTRTNFSPRPDPATDRAIFDGRPSTVAEVLVLLRARRLGLGIPAGTLAPDGSAAAQIDGAIGTIQEAITDGRLSPRASMRAAAPSEPARWQGALKSAMAATSRMTRQGRGGDAASVQARSDSTILQSVSARDDAVRLAEAREAATRLAAARATEEQAVKAATEAVTKATKPIQRRAGPSMGM
ncbi:MobF family relaxase [Roseomonas chloroacetimidivorans]|uniref:MobF family relaxase n=1 Tax=Roseomonas chloroacetimidivorans TaxID=1766656 RepID=UPI003C74AD0F